MSSPKYNHRSFQPIGPSSQGSSQHTHVKLNEPFEVIRQEIDVFSFDLGLLRNQRDEYESKVTSQINELNFIRQSLYELESQHSRIRQQYEDELSRLRAELDAIRRGTANPPRHTAAAGPASAGRSGHPASPASLPGAMHATDPGSHDPCYARDRDRDRDVSGIASGGDANTIANTFSKFETRSASKQSA